MSDLHLTVRIVDFPQEVLSDKKSVRSAWKSETVTCQTIGSDMTYSAYLNIDEIKMRLAVQEFVDKYKVELKDLEKVLDAVKYYHDKEEIRDSAGDYE